MKINLQLVKFEEKKNIIYFKLNEVNYYYNTKTQFIFKSDNKNKYSYDSSFDPKIKKLIKEFWDKFEYLFHEPQKNGRPKTYSKKELLGLTIACHEREIRTCRKIEKAVKNNDESLNYILNNKKPSKSTISSAFPILSPDFKTSIKSLDIFSKLNSPVSVLYFLSYSDKFLFSVAIVFDF